MNNRTIPPAQFQQALLAWYHKNKRILPWRQRTDAYAIWLAEIMLQQTTVTTVIPYFLKFLEHFPTVNHLAKAEEQQVLHFWQGLGYYSRARNLHKCAQQIVQSYNAEFPATAAELQKLPGIGPYTAAAIAAQAFNEPATVVDGNVERVISRLYCIKTPLPKAKPIIKEHAIPLTSPTEAGAYANAIMELGATVCTPTSPKCPTCPVSKFCKAHQQKTETNYPKKEPKKKRPTKHGHVWLVTDANNALYLRQRPQKGLLANLWEVPHTEWEDHPHPFPNLTFTKTGQIKHVFTHFTLNLTVHTAKTEKPHPQQHAFPLENLPPIPTLMKKVIETL
ncbi:MAG: A/G-specific adenine glycosylase [Alphaproteobacteria bacterium]|nr:A/G-specific adenine glycosylase [Alphaproteobacteria bacterium]MDD9919403.1 A/G-specific adenine glycosylase [Alphaproteobacteria bacterium]